MYRSTVINLLFCLNFIFICASGVQNKTSCLFCCKCDTVGPSDIYTVSGEITTLWCHLTSDKNITVDELYFTKGDEHFEYNKSISVDRTTINITFKVGNARDYSTTYYCRGNGSSDAHKRDVIVGKQFIEVENSPRPVSNLECRIFKFTKKNDQMQCTWYFNEDNYYKNEDDIEVELVAFNGATHKCPYMVNKRKCFWNFSKQTSFIPLNVGLWKVEVVVKNKRSNFTSDVVTLNFSSEDVTYIEPVTSPNVTYVTPSGTNGCIKLTFQPSDLYDPDDLEVMVTVHDKVLVYKYNTSVSSSPPFCGLLPFVRYDISIQTRLIGYKLWGQPTFVQAYYETKQIKQEQLESIWNKIKHKHYVIRANIKRN